MSSMKKNVLAAALVAGMGMAGWAAAESTPGNLSNVPFQYGTSQTQAQGSNPDLSDAEDVAIQQIFNNNSVYTMAEDIQFIVGPQERIIGRTTGFHVKITLDDASAKFNCTPTPTPHSVGPAIPGTVCNSVLTLGTHPHLADWEVYTESGGTGTNYILAKIQPKNLPPGQTLRGIPDGLILSIENAQVYGINRLRTPGQIVLADYEYSEPVGGNQYPLSDEQDIQILESVDVFECNVVNAGEPDKYIDVADHWDSPMVPKSRFSWDGKLGSSMGEDSYDSQYIDFGNLTIDMNPGTTATFLAADHFTTTLNAGANDDFLAFLNNSAILEDDDIYFVAAGASCDSTRLASADVVGNQAFFNYTWADIGGVNNTSAHTVKVCGYVNTDTVIDDTLITHTTLWLDRGGLAVSQGNAQKTCAFPALRYNGSTMEIFYLNSPTNSPNQESFIRLTNRSTSRGAGDRSGGWVRIEGIKDDGTKAAGQASVWVAAGGSVAVLVGDMENGTGPAVGGWGGAPAKGKWRAVVTAEFPGLVAASYVRNKGDIVVTNMTDTDTRGEQYNRDWAEGTIANFVGERPSDYYQETTPDFHGDGETDGPLGGPNDGTTPTGGSTDPNVPSEGTPGNAPGNPGL